MINWLLRTSLSLLFVLCPAAIAFGQSNYYRMWYFGNGIGLDFRSGSPSLIRGPMMAFEACASICDRWTGEVVLYTNGDTVWNGRNAIVRDGTGLHGNFSASQGALILQHPGDSLQYFIFTLDGVTVGGQRPSRNLGLNYSIVDMGLNNSGGAVTSKNIPLLATAAEHLVAVRHARGCGYWIVTHELGTNRFFSWHLNPLGLNPRPIISEVGLAFEPVEGGYMKASPDGTKLFVVRTFVGAGELLTFDPETGRVGMHIENVPATYGASFSPANNYIYYADNTQSSRFILKRMNLSQLREEIVATNVRGDEFRGMQIGPDGKIYVVYIDAGRSHLGVIPSPNGGGGIGFFPVAGFPPQFPLYYGLNNCVDGYLGMSNVGNIRDTIGVTADLTLICAGDSVRLRAGGASSYRWEPSTGLSCDTCPDPVARPTETTTYTLTAVNSEGCIETGSIVIQVAPIPVADAGPDTILCPGDSVRLRGGGGLAYRWYPGHGLSCVQCDSPMAAPERTTTYQMIAYGHLGCWDVDSVTVTVGGQVDIALVDTSICAGESVALLASGGKEYAWSPSTGLSCVDCPNPIASPTTTTTYVVESSIDGKCADRDSVTIVVHEIFADAGEDVVICAGESVRLQGSGGTEYSWTPAIDIDCPDCPDPVVTPRESTTYYVRVTDMKGCVAVDSVAVTVEPQVTVDVTEDVSLCAGESLQLSATGAPLYRWSPSDGLSCTDCPDPIATPESTTVYRVTGTSTSGTCSAVDSVRIVIHNSPIVDAGRDTAICEDASVRLGATGGMTYRWDHSSDLSCLDCPEPVASPKETTTYRVTGINAEGCSATDSVRVVVRPGIIVDAGRDTAICEGASVRFRATGAVRYHWEPAEGLSCIDCSDPLASPSKSTIYRVTGWSADGCEGSDEVHVAIREDSEIVRLRIRRDYRGRSDTSIVISVDLVDTIGPTDIAEFEFTLEYDDGMMQVDAESIANNLMGTALDGWNISIVEKEGGRLVLRAAAPPGATLRGGGALLRFASRLYLSNVRGTELPFHLSSSNRCYRFETAPGYAQLDSICGLNLRLMELSIEKYVPPVVYPNPARDRVTFEFGLGLDGATQLEIFNELGNRVGVVVDEALPSGGYAVEWDVRDVPSGVYWYRLTSGGWHEEGRLVIED